MFTVSGLSVASVSPRPPQQQQQQQQQQTSATNTSTTRYNNTNASPTKQPDSHNVPTASLLHGEYNEEESASSFAEALNEWRRAGTTSSVQTTAKLPQRSSSGMWFIHIIPWWIFLQTFFLTNIDTAQFFIPFLIVNNPVQTSF